MLTAPQFDAIPTNILKLYHEYEDSVIADMVRRLVKMDYVTSSAAWQMQRVIESGAVYEDVIKKLAGFTGKSEKELAEAFSAAGVKSMRFDDSIYKAAGLDPLPLNLSPQMAQVLANGLRTTNGLMQNITRSTALSAQRQFLQASDLAYLQVSSGAFSYDQAIKAAVKGIGESGLGVVYPSGRVDQLDVAVRRAVLTGVGKTSGDLQLARASEMGQDLVETSAHIGARPAHALWQGQVFSRSGTSKQYPDFVTSTGFGTALGLNGINCRHSFYPFFEGISTAIYEKAELESYSNKMVTYNGKKMTVYEATQEQRAIERQIRSFKRQESALQAGGLDASAEAAKVRDLQAKMRSFTKQTGLSRQGVREQAVSGGNRNIGDAVLKDGKSARIPLPSVETGVEVVRDVGGPKSKADMDSALKKYFMNDKSNDIKSNIADFNELPEQVRADAFRALERVQTSEYRVNNLGNIRADKYAQDDSVWATTFWNPNWPTVGQSIRVNLNAVQGGESAMMGSYRRMFSATRDFEEVITHELGHVWSRQFTEKSVQDAFAIYKGSVKNKISIYAASDADEMVAEAFAVVLHNNTERDVELAKAILDALKRKV